MHVLKAFFVGGVCLGTVPLFSESCFSSRGRSGGSAPGKGGGISTWLTGNWEMLLYF